MFQTSATYQKKARLTKTSLGGDRQQDNVVVMQPVNVLTRPWWAREM